jgi:hypothetical protein
MTVEWLGFARLVRPVFVGGRSLYDRVVGKAPHMNFESGDDGVKLRVHNPRGETVIIEEVRSTPSLLGFSNGQEIIDIARAVIAQDIPHEDALAVVAPEENVLLSLVTFDPFQASPAELVVKVKLRWRGATRGAFSRSVVTRKISVRDIRDLQRATDQRQPQIRILG